jgi:SRSO17 transposase
MTRREVERYRKALEKFLGEATRVMGRAERCYWAQAYVMGLLLDGERKSIQPMAGRLGPILGKDRDLMQGLQQFVNQSPWATAKVLKGMRDVIRKQVGGCGTFIIDDTSFPKAGKKSVGVSRQYCGALGKIANCQVGVTLHWHTSGQTVCLDTRLYLPRDWTEDGKRRRDAGVPREVKFQEKWKLSLDMLQEACAEGFSGVVLADAAYGSNSDFREGIENCGLYYCVGTESTPTVIAADTNLGPLKRGGLGRPSNKPQNVRQRSLPNVSIRKWAETHHDHIRRVTWREGSKGPLFSYFGAWRVRPFTHGRILGSPLWLLTEWPIGQQQPTKYFFSNLPENTSLKELVATAKARFAVEQSYREMKDELGLDHYEGRSWTGWYHHFTLVMLTIAFLALLGSTQKKKLPRLAA